MSPIVLIPGYPIEDMPEGLIDGTLEDLLEEVPEDSIGYCPPLPRVRVTESSKPLRSSASVGRSFPLTLAISWSIPLRNRLPNSWKINVEELLGSGKIS